MKYNTIVIGSGISGLTSALIAAKEGRKVGLFERDSDIAPLIRPYKRKGCCFSPGLHTNGWMDRQEIFACLFHYLGVADGIEQVLHEAGFGSIVVDGTRYRIPRGFDQAEASLKAYFPDDTEAIHHYFRRVKEINERLFYFNPLLPQSNPEPVELYTAKCSLSDFLKQYQASEALISVLGAMNHSFIGSRADEVPFEVHAIVWGGFYQSPGCYTVAGITRLLANFKRELTKYGVDLYLNAEVTEILTGQNRNVTGIRTQKGAQFLTDTVIATFHPKLLLDQLKPGILRSSYRQRLEEAENTFGMYVAFYKIVDYPDLEIENLIYYNNEQDVTLAVTTNRWEGNRILCVFLADPYPIATEDSATRREVTGGILEKIERMIENELPELKGKTRLLDFLKPWSYERYTKTIQGSAYGIKQSIRFPRFQHRVPVKGLYLAGQSLDPCFLGALISGFGLACEINGGERFWTKVVEAWKKIEL